MELVADILLVAGALGAGLYCFVLSRRLTRFTDLENGVGAAVAVLSAQVTDLQSVLETARTTASHSTDSLQDLTTRAEDAAKRLELMVASMHDLPPAPSNPASAPPPSEPVFARHARGAE
ncbi:MAG: hypothetical protein NXH80_00265 [Rhodobacteraceae bacterium]|nr:hypothetical protein [Paracoccaceae bacterium]